ncbi:MAG: response regulator transcription factor [Planctomycetota bacterium]
MTRKRVLIADDHQIFLDGLERLLQPEYDVVGKAANGTQLVALAKECDPDLIVTDYSMPDLNGVEAVAEIGKVNSRAKVVILTMHEDAEYASEAIEKGVQGYVLKRAAASELLAALREALEGRTWISPTVAARVLKRLKSGAAGLGNVDSGASEEDIAQRLSDRQKRIIALIVDGKIAKEIAQQLDISRKTVEYHKYKVMRALGIHSTAELIRFAVRNKLDQGPRG